MEEHLIFWDSLYPQEKHKALFGCNAIARNKWRTPASLKDWEKEVLYIEYLKKQNEQNQNR